MNLKQYLDKHKMSAAQFAETMGYTRQTINYYLAGTYEVSPRFAKLVSMATNGEVSLKEMVDYKDQVLKQKEKAAKTKQRFQTLEKAIQKVCCKKCKSKLQEMDLIDTLS